MKNERISGLAKNSEIVRQMATAIIPGLLASGHYTVASDESVDDEPHFITTNSKVAYEEGEACRYSVSIAVIDAIDIAKQLLDQVYLDYKDIE